MLSNVTCYLPCPLSFLRLWKHVITCTKMNSEVVCPSLFPPKSRKILNHFDWNSCLTVHRDLFIASCPWSSPFRCHLWWPKKQNLGLPCLLVRHSDFCLHLFLYPCALLAIFINLDLWWPEKINYGTLFPPFPMWQQKSFKIFKNFGSHLQVATGYSSPLGRRSWDTIRYLHMDSVRCTLKNQL